MMKKRIVLILALVLTLSLLTACGGKNDSNNNSTGKNTPLYTPSEMNDTENLAGGGGDLGDYSKEYINAHLGNNFSITFTTESKVNGNPDSKSTQTIIVTEEGYYGIGETKSSVGQSGSEYWYIKNADGQYDVWFRNSQGNVSQSYTSTDGWQERYSLDYLNMTIYDGAGMRGLLKKDGTETVAGRVCDKFLAGGKYPYVIDKETGLCLKYSTDMMGGVTMEFTVTEFKVGGQSLPAYQ